jgi:iron complex outermembrane receptor protein
LLFGNIGLQYGGSSALAGSGLIGGSLRLANYPEFNSPGKALFTSEMTQYGNFSLGTRISRGSEKMTWTGAGYFTHNRNQFKYTDLTGNKQTLDHALASSGAILGQADFVLSSNQKLSTGIWAQYAEREIPPTLVMTSSDQEQTDRSLRWTLRYDIIAGKQQYRIGTAVFSDQLHFKSPLAQIDAFYHLNSYLLQGSYLRQFRKSVLIEAGMDARLLRADVPYYASLKWQQELGFYGSLRKQWTRIGFSTVLNLRKDFVSGYKVPLCPSIGFEGKFLPFLAFRGNVSRNYRIPTMNDRFWQPGGNKDLRPESSFNAELGLIVRQQSETSGLHYELMFTHYQMMINDLIQWVSQGTNIWSPVNVNRVWSRGIETDVKSGFLLGKVKTRIIFGYTFSRSSQLIYASGSESHTQRQLIYVPLHQVNSMVSFHSTIGYVICNSTFTGKRFTTADNSAQLPGYFRMNLVLGKELGFDILTLKVQVEGKNLLNARYQVVQYYPEPGFTLMANLILTSTHKTK